VEKFVRNWNKAVDKVENFEEEIKATGMAEDALNNVVHFFNQVYGVQCYANVIRLA